MLTKRNKQVKPLPVPRSGIGRGFEHRVHHRSVVEKFFSKVFKISWFFRFREHWILKSANLSTGCYSIMGQNMGQTVLREIEEFFSNFSTHKTQEKVLKPCDFRTFYGCGGRTRTYDLRVLHAMFKTAPVAKCVWQHSLL